MENLLNEKLVEAIIMSASVGQFAQQLCEETFSEVWKSFDKAKSQLVNTAVSGFGAISVYFFTQDQFVAKAAGIAFLSGVFATTALKMLKKKNESANEKTAQLAVKLHEQEIAEKDAQIKELENKLKQHTTIGQ
jgi:hypothetical protein